MKTVLGWWRRRRMRALQRAAEGRAGIVTGVAIDVVQEGAALLLVIRDLEGARFYALDDHTAYRVGRSLLKKSRRAEDARRAARQEGGR